MSTGITWAVSILTSCRNILRGRKSFLVPERWQLKAIGFSKYDGGGWAVPFSPQPLRTLADTGPLLPGPCLSLPQHDEWKFTCLCDSQLLLFPVVGKVPSHWTKFCFDPGSIWGDKFSLSLCFKPVAAHFCETCLWTSLHLLSIMQRFLVFPAFLQIPIVLVSWHLQPQCKPLSWEAT